MKRKLSLGFVFIILLVGGVFAQVATQGNGFSQGQNSFSSSNVQRSSPGFSTYQRSVTDTDFFGLDPRTSFQICQERQDFIIQIAPGGCTPGVVRSDLLAEQNVPVFCQLQAIQVNPTIDTSSIQNIVLIPEGVKPAGILGISYQRPKSALKPVFNQRQGFATVENIGYAIILVQGGMAERDMPEFLNGTISARIKYDATNAFGFGLQNKFLPVLTDEQWRQDYLEYSFFDGNGYARLEKIDGDKITIGIYSDVNTRVDSFVVAKGETSSERYLSGFQCNAGYSVSYLESKKPQPKATILFDYDEYEVYQGEEFADGLCKVGKIEAVGGDVGNVDVVCKNEKINLNLKTRDVQLDIKNQETKFYSVGDVLFNFEEDGKPTKQIYLSGVGRYLIDDKIGTAFIVISENENLDSGIMDKISKGTVGQTNRDYQILDMRGTDSIYGKEIKFNSFQNIEDLNTGNVDFEKYFQNAINSYKEVEDTYDANEAYTIQDNNEKIIFAGEKALRDAIKLSEEVHKDKTYNELVEQLNTNGNYNSIESRNLIFNRDNAEHIFEFDGVQHVVSLKNVNPVNKEENYVKIKLDNEIKFIYDDGEYLISPEKGKSSIQVESFDETGVKLKGNCVNDVGTSIQQSETIPVSQHKPVCLMNVEVLEIKIEKMAKIRLNPINRHVGGVTNFSYGVGIEKRAIQLSPEKAAERIEKLNKSIEKWESISESLNSVVKGFKTACFATSAALQVKNLFSNLGGKAIARTMVMQEKWNDKCVDYAKQGYNSLDHCFSANSGAIEQDVNAMTLLIEKQQNEIKLNDKEFEGKSNGFLGGKVFDYESAFEKYKTKVETNYGSQEILDEKGNKVKVSDALEGVSDYETLRRIDLNLRAQTELQDDDLKKVLNENLYDDLSQAKSSIINSKVTSDYSDKLLSNGLVWGGDSVQFFSSENSKARAVSYSGGIADKDNKYNLDLATPFEPVKVDGKDYIVALNKLNENQYSLDKIYDADGGGELTKENNVYTTILERTGGQFIKFSSSTYSNKYENPLVRYYETEPYKGMPAVVPFDVDKGWYSATRQTLPVFGNTKTFEDSGRVSSFWVCNVGENGREEFNSGIGDDICQQINSFTGQTRDRFPGLNDDEAKTIISRGLNALESASSQYGSKKIKIEKYNFDVGDPQANVPELQCQNFMSPKDCKILFNVCDPVLCPSSRCNLGGKYYVDNVVQTGIIGSALMCLPNVKEGIAVPVCLTGVQAGVDNYVSILRASRDCLQESIDSGRYVGICDEITAIYQCEFFWKQISPAVNVLIPKLLEGFTGQGTRGGGEYLNVQSAWENMQKSINYFKQSYGENAFKAYNVRSTAEVGTQICKGFVSTRYPNKFKTLIEPDSPAQYSAWFDEIPGSDAVTPAISHYKVFYHIFAGNDIGTQYMIYLKTPEGSSFYQSSGNLVVDTGFISKGGYADETRDFTAPSGYRELCIRTNFDEKCGFKQVSTSFALNYVRDKYVASQLEEGNIDSEQECISGTSVVQGGSALSLVNPNLQSGVEDATMPKIYEIGIIRICSTENPGLGNDENRFMKVGTCGDVKIGCWLDSESVNRAITPGNKISTTILDNLVAENIQKEQADFVLVEPSEISELKSEVKELNNKPLNEAKPLGDVLIAKINLLKNKGLNFEQQVAVDLLHAEVNAVLAKLAWKEFRGTKTTPEETESPTKETGTTGGNTGDLTNDNRPLSEGEIKKLFNDVGISICSSLERFECTSLDYFQVSGNTCIGTCLAGLQDETIFVIYQIGKSNKGLQLTGAAEDEGHGANSAHYEGLAFDLDDNQVAKTFADEWLDSENSLNSNGRFITIILSLLGRDVSLSPADDFESKYGFPSNAISILYGEEGNELIYDRRIPMLNRDGYHFHIKVIDKTKIDIGEFFSESDTGSEIVPVIYNSNTGLSISAEERRYSPIVLTVSNEVGVDYDFLRAIIRQESDNSWNPNALGRDNDYGLMQVRDTAYNDVISGNCEGKFTTVCDASNLNGWNNVNNPSDEDIKNNVRVGACYLKCLEEVYGFRDKDVLASSYNLGPSATKKQCPSKSLDSNLCMLSNENYYNNVINYYQFYQTNSNLA